VDAIGRQPEKRPPSLQKSSKGLNLPLAGEPAPHIEAASVARRVALLGPDTHGLKPALLVAPGDTVRRGQPLYQDKKNEGVRYTAPASGRIAELHRGERRALISLVIEVDERGIERTEFETYQRRSPESLPAADVQALLVESGLWTAFRTRPFSVVPKLNARPAAIFVTATDTRPHAPDPALVLQDRLDDFRTGLSVLTRLREAPVFLCHNARAQYDVPAGVTAVAFEGPHPSGNAGWHIHRLMPAGLERSVWTIGYQDVAAIGRLFSTGDLDVTRVVSLAGPAVSRPRLLRTRLGASLEDLTNGELKPGNNRIISGSVLDGRGVTGPGDAFLGRYHLQIAALPEAGEREMFGFIVPGRDKFSVTNTVLGALRSGHRFALTTSTNGSPRAMVPIGSYERVMPFDMLPTMLLRALITKDDPRAVALGALELDEDDVALCTYVCPGKYEYGPMLRGTLERIEKEA
jgi:Na+-transporting NADH:ubiquinone oxidoreductase subunit A